MFSSVLFSSLKVSDVMTGMIDQAVVRCTDVEPVKAGGETAGNRRAQRKI